MVLANRNAREQYLPELYMQSLSVRSKIHSLVRVLSYPSKAFAKVEEPVNPQYFEHVT